MEQETRQQRNIYWKEVFERRLEILHVSALGVMKIESAAP